MPTDQIMGEPSSSVLQDIDQLFDRLKDLPDTARLSIVSKLQEKLTQVSSNDKERKGQKEDEQHDEPRDIEKVKQDATSVHTYSLSAINPTDDGETENAKYAAADGTSDTDHQEVKITRQRAKSRTRQKVTRQVRNKRNLKQSVIVPVPKYEKKITRSVKKSQEELKSNSPFASQPEPVECIVKIETIPEARIPSPAMQNVSEISTESNSEESSNLRISGDYKSGSEKFFNKTKKKRGRRKNPAEDRKCSICNKTFGTSAYLRIHMRKHTGEKPYQCDRCSRRFSQKSSLWVHLKRHDGKFDHHCTMCDYKSVLKVDLVRHVAKHSGSKVYICEQCGKMFTTDMRLRDHIRHVHERSETHICDKCAFSTHRADNLRRHIAVKHSDDEYFKCPVCGDMIKQRATFIVHLRRHTGERPHTCEECGKGFKSLSQLAVHRRTHKEGMHQCSECLRKFKTKHHLDRHMVVHTGAKPYSCMYCAYTCNVKGNINKHVKSVHKLLNFSFKKLNAASNSSPPISNEDAAVARGAQVTQDFLSRISLRKNENLTVEALQKELPKPNEVEEFPVIKIRGNSGSRKLKMVPAKKIAVAETVEVGESLHCLNSDALITDGKLIPVTADLAQMGMQTAIPIPSIECTYDSAGNELVDAEMIKARAAANSTDVLFLSVKEVLGDQAISSPTKVNVAVDHARNDIEDDEGTQTIYLISM